MTQASPLTGSNPLLGTNWQEVFHAAVLEVDPHKLQTCVTAAEVAILKRCQEITGDVDLHRNERRALEDALATLRVLKRELPEGSASDRPQP